MARRLVCVAALLAMTVLADAKTDEKPMPVGGEVRPPVAIARVEPDYEPCARKKVRVRGLTILEAVIERDGTVRSLRLLKSAEPCTAKAALEAMRQWKFKPATYRGKPVACVMSFTVNIHVR